MIKPTASGLERAMRCGASLRLPVIESTSAAAEAGAARHAFLARVRVVGRDAALAEVPEEHRAICAALPVDELPTDLACEVAYAYDVAADSCREIGRNVGRNYGVLAPMELAGTADVVGVAEDRVYVADYKSAGYRGRAADSMQLRFLALAAATYHSVPAARVEIIRLTDDGGVSRSWHDYDELDLDAFAHELREWFARAGQGGPVEGPWCHGCKSALHCPAKVGLIQLAAGGQDIAAPFMGGLSRGSVGKAYQLAESLKGLTRELERRIFAAVEELGPCPMPDGRELRMVIGEGRETLDGDVAHRVLTGMLGREAADQAVEMRATKEGIRRALKGKVASVEPALREVVDRVRQEGGARRSTPAPKVEAVDASRKGAA